MKNLKQNKHLIFSCLLLLNCVYGFATVYEVGLSKAYLTPNALYNANVLQNGDTIEIEAGNYIGTDALAVWLADDLVIKGVGGRPHLQANGQYIWGKGIWVIAGNNATVENIEFSGAAVPSLNGAGIRLDGFGLTVRHCYFHNNENGILTINTPNAGDILVEYCEFGYNGYGDGYSHNIYVNQAASFTFRYNYSHHANVGHCVKSRANENYIYYNRIMDEQTGIASRLIDISNGGFSIIMGNLLMQGELATNNNLIGYGLEELTNSAAELYVVNNTMLNKRAASCIFLWIQSGTSVANVSNNIFGGTGTIINGTTTSYSNNYINTNINTINFVDEPNFDYNLNEFSPAVDFGTALPSAGGYSFTPDKMYAHPTNFDTRVISNGIIDAGAYEYGSNVIPPAAANCETSIEMGDFCVHDSAYGVILTAPNGNCFRLKVTNSGELTTEPVECP